MKLPPHPSTLDQGPACAGIDLNLFFREGPQPGQSQLPCKDCPIQPECLEWGLHVDEHGIWGGMTREQRKKLRSKRGIVSIHPLFWNPHVMSEEGANA